MRAIRFISQKVLFAQRRPIKRRYSTSDWRAERSLKLHKVYDPYFKHLDPKSMEYKHNSRSGIAFNKYFKPFENFKKPHLEFIEANPEISSIPKNLPRSEVFRFGVNLKFTQESLRLEGTNVSYLEMMLTNSAVCPTNNMYDEYDLRMQEAYGNEMALNFARNLLVGRHDDDEPSKYRFDVNTVDIQSIHWILMRVFSKNYPGQIRNIPIQIKGYPAVFPYPSEILVLMRNLCHWVNDTEYGHPILLACDFFLNFCHIHPFIDGNGRLGRILQAMILIYYGIEPVMFIGVSREEYLDTVYKAQQENQRELYYQLVVKSLINEMNLRSRKSM